MTITQFRLSLAIFPLMAVLCSCGNDPKGKFVDDNKQTGSIIDTVAHFVHNPTATQWQSDWSTSTTLVYHWKSEPDNLHPSNGRSNPRRVVLDYTQRFLVSTDLEKLELRPDLIKAMPTVSADGLSYTYELRDEPVWDDGSPLTAADIEFTLKAWKCPQTANAYAKPSLETINSFKADPGNPKKFTLVMSKKYIQNVAVFGDIPIMQRSIFDSKKVFDKYPLSNFSDSSFINQKHDDINAWADDYNNAKYGREVNMLHGLGAYEVTLWEPKTVIELTKKKNHWTSKVQNPNMYDISYPEKIIFKINTDDNSIALEMKKQVIDVSTWVSTHGLVELQKDKDFNRNYHSAFLQNFLYQYIGMNNKPQSVNRKPFFVDKKVRQAMSLLIPIDQANRDYLDGKAIRMTSLAPPTKTKIYNTNLKVVPFSIDSAKKLLDEAGWVDTDGDNIRDKMIDGKKTAFDFEFMIMNGNPVTENIANDVTNAMKSAGIKCNVRKIEFVTFYEVLAKHDFDMYMGAWASSFFAEDYKQIWHSSSWANEGSNYVGYSNPESDQLIDKIRETLDDSTRGEMEKQLQEIVYEDRPYVFMFQTPVKAVIHKRFDNPDMYFEKPGVYLSNLRPMTSGTMVKTAPTE
jgi:peptide/nickel transport system substrate-binding protein